VIDVLRLIRAHNLLIAAAGVVAGGWIARGAIVLPIVLVWAAVSAAGFGAAGNARNDLADAPADRVNRPPSERPFARGRVRRGTLDLCVAGGAFVGCLGAALVSGWAVLVGLAALAAMIAYSPYLKRTGLAGNVVVSVVSGLPLFYGALAVGNAAAGLVPWALAAWLHLARELTKDVDDVEGDRLVGRRTLAVTLGPGPAARIASLVSFWFVPVSVALPWAAGYGAAYFPAAAPAQVLALGAGLRLRRGRAGRVSFALKVAMVLGLVALTLGRVW